MTTHLKASNLFLNLFILSLSCLIALTLSNYLRLRHQKLLKSKPLIPIASSNTVQFLNIIKLIESSDGRNTSHRIISTGIHQGDSAVGVYGIMPNTLLEISNRLNKLHKYNPLKNNKKQYQELFKRSPEDEQYVAEFLASNLLARMHGDILRAAYAWCYGTNLQPLDITPQMLYSSYVRKFYHISSLK